MTGAEFPLVCAALFVVAVLYSAVGHAGASGYIAVLTLFGFSAQAIRPISLVLNILVATIGTVQFARAGHFRWSLFWPFAALAVPLAFVGGYVTLPTHWLKVLIGVVLLASAAKFLAKPGTDAATREPARPVALGVGGGLGLLAGLTGTGGGIFLTPVLLVMRWAPTKQASAVSATFILVNSISGLAGFLAGPNAASAFDARMGWFAVTAIGGGALGATLGARQLAPNVIKRLLAIVLVIAGLKLVFT